MRRALTRRAAVWALGTCRAITLAGWLGSSHNRDSKTSNPVRPCTSRMLVLTPERNSISIISPLTISSGSQGECAARWRAVMPPRPCSSIVARPEGYLRRRIAEMYSSLARYSMSAVFEFGRAGSAPRFEQNRDHFRGSRAVQRRGTVSSHTIDRRSFLVDQPSPASSIVPSSSCTPAAKSLPKKGGRRR